MKAAFTSRQQLTPSIATFWFEPEKHPGHQAGQFIELTIPHESDNRGFRRWFTLSSAPTNKLVGITTKLSNQPSTFKQALVSLKPGDKVDISQPMGDFVLPKDKTVPLLFAVAGIGITPANSILEYLKDSGEKRTIRILYAVSSINEIAFSDMVRWGDPKAQFLISKPKAEEPPAYLNSQLIAREASQLAHPFIFLSGPEELVEVLFAELREKGIKDARLVTDYFQGYSGKV